MSDDQEARPVQKHAFASDAVRRGVDLYRLRDFLGHTDARSTEKYAKLADVDGSRCCGECRSCRRLVARPIRATKWPAMTEICGGADGTRTRNFRRDRPVL